MKARIALLPGDGIGPEVTTAATGALEQIARSFGHEFSFTTSLIGGAALDGGGPPLPAATLEAYFTRNLTYLLATLDPAFGRRVRR